MGEEEEEQELKPCKVCGQPSPEMICRACKEKIQAELLEQKRVDEKRGRPPT